MAERDLKKYLQKKVTALKGEARKVSWEGRNNAPDWFVMTPVHHPFFVEIKDDGEVPNTMQSRELMLMINLGVNAGWANSEPMLDQLFDEMSRG